MPLKTRLYLVAVLSLGYVYVAPPKLPERVNHAYDFFLVRLLWAS